MSFYAGLLGLRRTATSPVLPLLGKLAVVIRTVLLIRRPPAFPPKIRGGGIFLLCQPYSVTGTTDSV
jgi:hypothetical protein